MIAAGLQLGSLFEVPSPLYHSTDDYIDVAQRVFLGSVKLDRGLYSDGLLCLIVFLHADKIAGGTVGQSSHHTINRVMPWAKRHGIRRTMLKELLRSSNHLLQSVQSAVRRASTRRFQEKALNDEEKISFEHLRHPSTNPEVTNRLRLAFAWAFEDNVIRKTASKKREKSHDPQSMGVTGARLTEWQMKQLVPARLSPCSSHVSMSVFLYRPPLIIFLLYLPTPLHRSGISWRQVGAPSKIIYTSKWGRDPVYNVRNVHKEYIVSMCPAVVDEFLELIESQGVHLAWLEFTGSDLHPEGYRDSTSVFLLNHEAWRENGTCGETSNNKEAIDEALQVLNYGLADIFRGNYEGRLLLHLSNQQQNQLTRLRQLIPRTISLQVRASVTATLMCVGCPIPENKLSFLPRFFSRRDIDGNPDMAWKVSAQHLHQVDNQIIEFSDGQVLSLIIFRTTFRDPPPPPPPPPPPTLSHHPSLVSSRLLLSPPSSSRASLLLISRARMPKGCIPMPT